MSTPPAPPASPAPPAPPAPPTPSLGLMSRLSFMMFLQYAIWGAWLPLMYPFLSRYREFSGAEIGYLFMIGGVGAVVAPFIAGQIADRYFNTEKYLGLSHILGAVLVWQLAWLDTFWMFFVFSLLYSLIYSPTLALTNSLSFHHLPDRDRDFGKVRLWGTIGWIAIGICIGQLLLYTYTPDRIEPAEGVTAQQIVQDPEQYVPLAVDANPKHLEGVLTFDLVEQAPIQAPDVRRRTIQEGLREAGIEVPMTLDEQGQRVMDDDSAVAALAERGIEIGSVEDFHGPALGELLVNGAQAKGVSTAFQASAILGLIMGAFCLTLPATPPTRNARSIAVFEALSEVTRQPLLTLFLIAIPISCVHQFYFVHTAGFVSEFQSQAKGMVEFINNILGVGGGGLMTIGQMSELAVLAIIPFVAKRFSRKSFLTIGIIAYALRMFLFAYVDAIAAATGIPPVAILMAGIALHGVCFGAFIFVAIMIVDEQTTPDVRASAQTLFGLVVFGIGIIVGSIFAGQAGDWATTNGIVDYRYLFSIPLWASVACLVLLVIFYPGGRQPVIEPVPAESNSKR